MKKLIFYCFVLCLTFSNVFAQSNHISNANEVKIFGLVMGKSTEKDFKNLIKHKEWQIVKSGYRIIKSNIVNPYVRGYVVEGIPLDKLDDAIFMFFKGKLMSVTYELEESMDKSTFYEYFNLLKQKHGEPTIYYPPNLQTGKAIWSHINGSNVTISLICPWVTTITYLTCKDMNLWKKADYLDKKIYQEEIKKKAKQIEGF